MMRRKAVLVLQAVLLAVLVFQVRALADCGGAYCNPWTTECDDPSYGQNCHNHSSETAYDWGQCCCVQPGFSCCNMLCWFYHCYTNPHTTDGTEQRCTHARVTRSDSTAPPEELCGEGYTVCHN